MAIGNPGPAGIGLLEWMRSLISGRSRPQQVDCSVCGGSGQCPYCEGKGCARCDNTGQCFQCHGKRTASA